LEVALVTETPLPLADLRVIEMGQLLAGPFCGQLLGDFGAEVIKVEDPGKGDPMRQWGREKPHGLSLWWPVVARNKKSVTIDLRHPRGQGLVRRLAATADVLVENFRPGTLERWGLSPDDLLAANPGLVITRVSGFGQTGPYASRAGYGSIGEAMGGIRYVTGDPSRPPSRTGISLGDSLAAVFAAVGTLVALHARQRTGRGQLVDAAIYESVLALMESLIPEWQIAGYQRERTGPVLPNVAPSNVYTSSDGEDILIAANQDTVYRRLAEVMGRPELADDERFRHHDVRGRHMTQLDALISEWAKGLTADELLARLEAAGVPAGRIFRAKDMLSDPHFAARQAIVRLMSPELGDFAMQNVFPRLSATPGSVRHLGPALGEHNQEVFSELLGLSDADIHALVASGVISATSTTPMSAKVPAEVGGGYE
jgi:formyl-CoA transferase